MKPGAMWLAGYLDEGLKGEHEVSARRSLFLHRALLLRLPFTFQRTLGIAARDASSRALMDLVSDCGHTRLVIAQMPHRKAASSVVGDGEKWP